MQDKLKKIIENYGVLHQLKHFQSETYELAEAILFNELTTNFYGDREHIVEEIADVMVMLEQFKLHYGIKEEELKDIMEYKINRQLERIKKENNNVQQR